MQGFQDKIGEIELVGAIMRASVVGADYYRTPCGRWWADVGGLDSSALFRKAVKGTKRQDEPYMPLEKCPLHSHDHSGKEVAT